MKRIKCTTIGLLFSLIFMIVNLAPAYAVHSAKALPKKEKISFIHKVKHRVNQVIEIVKHTYRKILQVKDFDWTVWFWFWLGILAWGMAFIFLYAYMVSFVLFELMFAEIYAVLTFIFYILGCVLFIVWLFKFIDALYDTFH